VYRGTSPGGEGATPLHAGLGPSSTSFNDTTAVNGVTYYYEVSAVNSAGETKSAEESGEPTGAPAAPVVVASPHVGSVTLTWTLSSDGGSPITNFDVFRGTSPGGEGSTPYAAGLPASPLTFPDPSVTKGTTYYYTVRADNALGMTMSAEVSTVPGGTVDVFAASPTAGVVWNRVSGNTAAAPVALGGALLGDPAAVSDSSGSAVFVRGTDNGIYWNRIVNGAPQGWQSLGGATTADPVAVVTGTAPNDQIDVFVRGGDGAVYWKQITGSVASPTIQPGFVALGGFATSSPTAAVAGATLSSPGSTAFVFVRGGDGAVYMQRLTGTSAGTWVGLGGLITSDPAATPDNFNGGVTVFARGGDLAMYRQHVDANGTLGGWLGLGGGITSDPGVAFDGTHTIVFARGNDLSVYEMSLSSVSTTGTWTALGGASTSDPEATYDGTNVRVAVRGGDLALYWQSPGVTGWTGIGGLFTSRPALAPLP
jgi:hypothetical protein